MQRWDVPLDQGRKLVLLMDDERNIWIRLLAPVQGRLTYLTPKLRFSLACAWFLVNQERYGVDICGLVLEADDLNPGRCIASKEAMRVEMAVIARSWTPSIDPTYVGVERSEGHLGESA